MLKNYIKIAFRNIRKNPGYSFINIFGLALGMGISILILLYVQFELSYDTYHKESDRIYRVSREWFNENGATNLHLGQVAPPFGPLLEREFEPVQEAVRFLRTSPLITYESKSFVENRFFFADANVFDIFSWKLLLGNSSEALTSPDAIVITRSTARKYFGSKDPIGKPLEFQVGSSTFQFQVTGVVEDVPENSHFQFDFLASMKPVVRFYGGVEQMMTNYGSNNFATYLLLSEGYDFKELLAQIPGFIDRHMPAGDNGIPASEGTTLNLWPLTDIHLYSQLDSEIEANGNIEYVYIFTAIAFFILLIACINFMNLSTARSANRAVEVGLRKVVGANRGSLIKQFIGESIILALLSLVVAVLMVEVLLPYFNNFIDKSLDLHLSENWVHLAGLTGIVLFVGLIAGSYPAFFLSGFQPATVLKGSFKADSVHERFRSVLVVAQFTISVGLISCMAVIYNQLEFMRDKDLGFDKENIVVLPSSDKIENNYENIRKQMVNRPGIVSVSLASRVPSGRLLDSQDTQAEVNGELQHINVRIADIHVSHNFMETFGIDLVAGRDFDLERSSDSTEAFILNEEAIEAIGWTSPDEAVDKQFYYGNRRGRVIGVAENFNFESLHQSIAPIVFLIPTNRINSVAVKFKEGMREETLAYLEKQWSFWRPDFPFSYYFVEDRFDRQYNSEEQLGKIFGYFSILAVVIAALGLLGLASFTAQQRTKEIGIRKVLGASVSQIVMLLSKRFTWLVLVSIVLAAPLAYLAMGQWLHSFAYRIDVSIWPFALAGAVALLIAWFTISYQSVKAALMNPVKSLRSE